MISHALTIVKNELDRHLATFGGTTPHAELGNVGELAGPTPGNGSARNKVSVIRSQVDMRVLGEYPTSADLVAVVDRTGADIVVTDTCTAECEQVARLLKACPQVRVLGIDDDGRQRFLHLLRPYRISLGEASAETLVDAIRARGPVPFTGA